MENHDGGRVHRETTISRSDERLSEASLWTELQEAKSVLRLQGDLLMQLAHQENVMRGFSLKTTSNVACNNDDVMKRRLEGVKLDTVEALMMLR